MEDDDDEAVLGKIKGLSPPAEEWKRRILLACDTRLLFGSIVDEEPGPSVYDRPRDAGRPQEALKDDVDSRLMGRSRPTADRISAMSKLVGCVLAERTLCWPDCDME